MGAAAKKQVDLNDQELDAILASVEASLEKADKLAKNLPSQPNGGQPMKKDDEPGAKKPGEEDAPPAPPAGDEPPADGGAPDAGAPPADAGAPDQGAPAPGEGELAGEAEQPLSDEELDQIYGSMQPEELQRHYMAIRAHLEQAMGGASPDQGAAPAAPPAAPPAAAAAMGKSEAPVAENEEFKALKAKNEELEKAITTAVKAVELVLQPARKSAAGLEFVKKNEELEGKGSEDLGKLSKSDIDGRIRQIGATNMTKSERDTVNNYLLHNEGKERVLDIIKSKGGK
jgi:hypothetical protein